jgi:hypothetical protein
MMQCKEEHGVIDYHTTINRNYLGGRYKACLDETMSFQLMQTSYGSSPLDGGVRHDYAIEGVKVDLVKFENW